MPIGKGYDSDKQRRFFHAAVSPGFQGKETGITKKDVQKRDVESRGKKLPEQIKKTARALGRLHALDQAFSKEAVSLEPLLASALRYGAPGAAGYYLAGPGYRTEGAIGGMLAGHLAGPGMARLLARKMRPELAASVGKKGGPESMSQALEMVRAGKPIEGIKDIGALQKQLQLGEKWIGPVGAGAAGGFGAGRLLGLQNPYGLQPVFPGYGRENPYGMRPE